MKRILFAITLGVMAAMLLPSCQVATKSMKEPANHIQFVKDDFTYSDQVSGEASETKILMIDWARLFSKNMGEIKKDGGFKFSIPVIGGLTSSKVFNYALYNIIQDNPGYDIVLYPQAETVKISYLGIVVHSKVKVTARLGKLKK